MRALALMLVMAITVGLGACASTPESRLRNEIFLEIYWAASKQCEAQYHTLYVERIGTDGSLSVTAAAESRIEAQPFRECYWAAVRERADRWQAAGRTLPDRFNVKPDIDFD
jgi:hypothetical protein